MVFSSSGINLPSSSAIVANSPSQSRQPPLPSEQGEGTILAAPRWWYRTATDYIPPESLLCTPPISASTHARIVSRTLTEESSPVPRPAVGWPPPGVWECLRHKPKKRQLTWVYPSWVMCVLCVFSCKGQSFIVSRQKISECVPAGVVTFM